MATGIVRFEEAPEGTTFRLYAPTCTIEVGDELSVFNVTAVPGGFIANYDFDPEAQPTVVGGYQPDATMELQSLGDVEFIAVPEPNLILSLILGMVALAMWRWGRERRGKK